jgi:hypothetical protein
MILHLGPFSDYSESVHLMLTLCYTRIGVPAFFAISGFIFFRNTSVSADQLKLQLRRKWRLYTAWTICYLPTIIYNFRTDVKYSGKSAGILILYFVRRFFLVGSWTPLWFFLALAYGLPIAWIMIKKLPMKVALFFSGSIYFIFSMVDDSFGWNTYGWLGSILFEKYPIFEIINGILFKIGVIWSGISICVLYLIIGAYIHQKLTTYEKYDNNIYIYTGFVISLLLLTVEFILISRVSNGNKFNMTMAMALIPSVYYLLRIFIRLQTNNEALSKYLRKISVLMYGAHPIASYWIHVESSFYKFMLILVIVIVGGVAVIELSKVKGLQWLRVLY